ncbi:hypothetical protein Goari_018375 [Gossypium aridum]|uniref:Uncharacterized protein n=1 Tax=Gossypium aridum TaxID=34290 RepID=A0A7J8WPZ5_GOSAI|nr:hypothetical protein [Gossypium aridum]
MKVKDRWLRWSKLLCGDSFGGQVPSQFVF